MEKDEAKKIILDEVAKLKALEYDELLLLLSNPYNIEVTTQSGGLYHVEVQVFWNDSFIITPEGLFLP